MPGGASNTVTDAWQRCQDQGKFARLGAFGQALPCIRAQVERLLAQAPARGAPSQQQVCAAVIRLLDTTLMRVGNEAYARHNHSYGLTTLRTRHARLDGQRLELDFRGKSGVRHHVALEDADLARAIRRCRDLPGPALFTYTDDTGKVCAIDSPAVNAFLRQCCRRDVTAKDFRTWHASVLALDLARHLPPAHGLSLRRHNALTLDIVRQVAARLGNTPSVCRKSYVHPDILGSGMGWTPARPPRRAPPGLSPAERRLLAFLENLPRCQDAARPSAPVKRRSA